MICLSGYLRGTLSSTLDLDLKANWPSIKNSWNFSCLRLTFTCDFISILPVTALAGVIFHQFFSRSVLLGGELYKPRHYSCTDQEYLPQWSSFPWRPISRATSLALPLKVNRIKINTLFNLRSCEASLRNELLECGVDEKTKMDDLQGKITIICLSGELNASRGRSF